MFLIFLFLSCTSEIQIEQKAEKLSLDLSKNKGFSYSKSFLKQGDSGLSFDRLGLFFNDNNILKSSGGSLDSFLSISPSSTESSLNDSWAPQKQKLLLYLPFNNNFNDESGQGHVISTGGSPSLVANGKVGEYAASFNSSTQDYLQASTLLGEPDTISISLWLKREDITDSGDELVSIGDYLGLRVQIDGKIRTFVKVSTTTWNNFNSGLVVKKEFGWVHFAATYKSGKQKVYLNGKLVREHNLGEIVYSGSQSVVRVGAHSSDADTSFFYTGLMDEVAIWGSELTSGEISLIYEKQKNKYTAIFESEILYANQNLALSDLEFSSSLPSGKDLGVSSQEDNQNYSKLQTDLRDGLVFHFPLNETQVGTISDTGPYGLTTSLVGGVSEDSCSSDNTANCIGSHGKLGQGVQFNGDIVNNQYIEIDNSVATEDLQEGSYTLSAWYYAYDFPSLSDSRGSASGLITKIGRHSGLLLTYQPKFSMSIYDSSNIAYEAKSNMTLEKQRWYHVVGTLDLDNSKVRLYINGVLETETSIPTNIELREYNQLPFKIGAAAACATQNYCYPANGIVDEVSAWSRTLSEKEVLSLYQRVSNQIKFQIKSCVDENCECESFDSGGDASDCDGDGTLNEDDNEDTLKAEFKGPGGTGATYFSELFNRDSSGVLFDCSGQSYDSDTVHCQRDEISLSGVSKSERFSVDLSKVGTQFSLAQNQYYQIRAILQSHGDSSCDSSLCSPELKQVSLYPDSTFSNDQYAYIESSTPISLKEFLYFQIESFGSCAFRFQISDDGSSFYTYNGSWASTSLTTPESSMSLKEVNDALKNHRLGNSMVFRILMKYSENQKCIISKVNVKFKN